jgi:hypothetical protein
MLIALQGKGVLVLVIILVSNVRLGDIGNIARMKQTSIPVICAQQGKQKGQEVIEKVFRLPAKKTALLVITAPQEVLPALKNVHRAFIAHRERNRTMIKSNATPVITAHKVLEEEITLIDSVRVDFIAPLARLTKKARAPLHLRAVITIKKSCVDADTTALLDRAVRLLMAVKTVVLHMEVLQKLCTVRRALVDRRKFTTVMDTAMSARTPQVQILTMARFVVERKSRKAIFQPIKHY